LKIIYCTQEGEAILLDLRVGTLLEEEEEEEVPIGVQGGSPIGGWEDEVPRS